MRVLGKIFSGICAVAFMCSMQAAPAKSSTAKKSSKPKLELELKGISEAKKLYKFLESNEGKIVELNISIPYESFDLDRIFFYTSRSVNKNGEEICEIQKNKFTDWQQEYTTIEKSEIYDKCKNERIEYHFGKNALKSSDDRQNMDEKWKKANSDIVLFGEGYFDGAEGTVAEYYLNNGYIAFEDYQGNGKSQFYSIKIDGHFGSYVHGLFFVPSAYVNDDPFEYLETTGHINYGCDVGDYCEGNANVNLATLQPMDADVAKVKAILEYLGK